MKNLFLAITASFLVLFFLSCEAPKKPSDNQTVSESAANTEQTTQPVDSTANNVNPNPNPNRSRPAAREHAGENKTENMNGSQVIDKAVNKLNNKINLSDTQLPGLKDALTKTFLGMGEDLNKSYTNEQSKLMSRDMIQKSSGQIVSILDSTQKVQFNNFLEHQKSFGSAK